MELKNIIISRGKNEKVYDKTIATDTSTTVIDPEIKNAVFIARI